MAINKNFVIKNGLEVNTNVLVAAADEKQVGIGTTRPYYKLHVGGGEGSRGGIGATDLTISGIATIGVGNSSQGALKVVGISTIDGDIDLLGSAGVSTVLWDASENRLEFKDNASVGFGTGNDLTLWHDGSVSYIKDTVGDFRIAGDKITLELEDGTNVKVIDQFGVNITGVTTTNRLLVSGVSTLTSVGSNLIPDTDGSRNIGAATSEWQDLFIDGTANIDTLAADTAAIGDLTNNRVVIAGSSGELEDDSNLTYDGIDLNIGAGTGVTISNTGNIAAAGIATIGGTLTVVGNVSLRGDVDLGDASDGSDIISALGRFDTSLIPSTDGARDLGSSALEWNDLYIDGTANIDTLAADTAAIGDLTDNRVVIAGSSGELEDDANFTYDGVGLNIGAGSGVTVSNTGNISASGIVTANGGINVGTAVTIDAETGNVAVSGIMTVGGNLYVTGDITYDEVTGRNLNITGISTFSDDILFNASNDIRYDNSASSFIFDDNAKAIFGSSSDGLEIFHNGNNSFLKDSGTGELFVQTNSLKIENAVGDEAMISALQDGAVELFHNGAKIFQTTGAGVTVGLSSIQHNGNAAFPGIVTAGRFIGIHTSTDGGGVGIGSTTAHVGYGITYIDFKGPGVSTVYYSSVTGVSTVYFQGGGGSSVGAAGTWQNDGSPGISTAKSVGINTNSINDGDLQGRPYVGAAGSFQGLYIGNGMVVNDNQLNGDHYIGTAFGGMMAGPVTVNGVLTVDGNYVVV